MKTIRTAPLALLALLVSLALVGSSCSSVNPVALSVDGWSISTREFKDQATSWADVYERLNGATQAQQLQGTGPGTWSTSYTSFLLNQQMNFHLATVAAEERGLEITDDDLAQAQTQAEQAFTDSQGTSHYADLSESYRTTIEHGLAADAKLQAQLVAEGTTDEALRRVYDSDPTQFAQACVRHILVLAGNANGQTTPSDADYATALAAVRRIQGQVNATNFADVATTSSQDTGSASKGGDLGCNAKGAFVAEFDDAVWSQPVGEVGPPVKTQYGYHLILVSSRTQPTFEQAKAQIAKAVQSNASKLVDAELTRQAQKATIFVDGLFGRFDASTGSITTPEGAARPAGTTDVASLPGATAR